MVIDIKRTVIKINLRRFITLVILIIFMVIVMLAGSLQRNYFGLTKYQWAIIIAVVYILFSIIESLREFQYIFFTDEGERIILRYFSMGLLNHKKQSIEIPKKSMGSYKLIETLGGFRQKLILHQKFKEKEAKYPPVSITALSKEEKKKLLKALDKYIR